MREIEVCRFWTGEDPCPFPAFTHYTYEDSDVPMCDGHIEILAENVIYEEFGECMHNLLHLFVISRN